MQCDAFTAEAGTGNAAAVVFSQRKGDAKWMQKDRGHRATQGIMSITGSCIDFR